MSSLQKPVDLTLVHQIIKGFLHLMALSSGMPILLMELTIFSGVLGFRGCGHWWRSSEHGISLNLHEDTFGVYGEPGVNCLKLRPPFSRLGISVATIKILIPRHSSLLQRVRVVSTDLCGTNEICNLS